MISVRGVDPGVKESAVADLVWDGERLSVRSVWMVRGGSKLASIRRPLLLNMLYTDGLVVEGQQVYRPGTTKEKRSNPRTMVDLAQVAGAFAGALPAGAIAMPLPAEWKGQHSKKVSQSRICRALGWAFRVHETKREPWVEPLAPSGTDGQALRVGVASEWKHILDAVGLAMWGLAHFGLGGWRVPPYLVGKNTPKGGRS